MHARVLVELAALLASHGEVLLRGSARLSNSCLADYWSASKCRLDRWTRAIGTTRKRRETPGQPQANSTYSGPSFRPWLEEIITGEVLTRVWTAVVCGLEKHNGSQEAEPVVRSVLLGHLEARRKTLRLLVTGRGVDSLEAVALNRLRRRSERWTDMLLGRLIPICDVRDLAFDVGRAADFARGIRAERGQPWGSQVWPLLLASLQAAFRSSMAPDSPNDDLNLRIASSILACFGADLFESTGQFQSLWQVRLTHTANDTVAMIDQLLSDSSIPGSWPPSVPRTPRNPRDGWRRSTS